jgi:hypothetical protein
MKSKKKQPRPLSPESATSCEYCENPDRYNLDPVREERTEEVSQLDKVIRFTSWHYETVVYCRDAPRARVRCRKNTSK